MTDTQPHYLKLWTYFQDKYTIQLAILKHLHLHHVFIFSSPSMENNSRIQR